MNDLFYLSRYFVEFGPFPKKDILDLKKRGLLYPTDYLLAVGSDAWVQIDEWMSSMAAAPVKAAKAATAVKPPAKAATKVPAAKRSKSAA
jgi:hypothetical protein